MTYSVFAVQVKLVLLSIILLLMRNNLGNDPLINRASLFGDNGIRFASFPEFAGASVDSFLE
jgi:hypothetical protein